MTTISRTCTVCKAEKPLSEFPNGRGFRNGVRPHCKACKQDMLREWRARNPDKGPAYWKRGVDRDPEAAKQKRHQWYLSRREQELEKSRVRNYGYRKTVLQHYSNGTMTCACCLENHFEFLAIDHINGGGNKHRKSLGAVSGGVRFYRWLVQEGFPAGYRVLCHNCNMSRGFYGMCPHEMEKQEGV